MVVLSSCFNQNHRKMIDTDKKQIINEIKKISDAITHYAERAQSDSLLQCYSDSADFLAFSGDGKMRRYDEFKKLCIQFYNSVKGQEVTTIQETFNVIDTNLVIVGWTGNINAFFKNGDTMKLKDYAVTFVFKKIDNKWKVIHSHESSLPPEIRKSTIKN
jgi:ketosteroid isomerase-like protein